jgi:hypothetical protein
MFYINFQRVTDVFTGKLGSTKIVGIAKWLFQSLGNCSMLALPPALSSRELYFK